MTAKRVTDLDRAVSARIRLHRQRRGVSQQFMAEQLGVTYQQWQKLETGMNRISAGRVIMIANALSVAPSEFLDAEILPIDNASGEALRAAATIDTLDPPLRRIAVHMLQATVAGLAKTSAEREIQEGKNG